MNPFRRFFRRKPIGFPLGQQVPAGPADHAEDFSHRYAEPLDWRAGIRMEALGIPNGRIGSNDHLHGLVRRAFNPFEREGGGITHAGQINLDSGMLNPELLTEKYGPKAGKLWAKSRLRDRQDALIAHEDAEWRMGKTRSRVISSRAVLLGHMPGDLTPTSDHIRVGIGVPFESRALPDGSTLLGTVPVDDDKATSTMENLREYNGPFKSYSQAGHPRTTQAE